MKSSSVIEPDIITLPPTARDAAVERDFVWNACVGMLFEGTWALGNSFVIVSVVIPTYLNALAAPKWLIGFMSAMGVFTVPLQLLSDRFFDGARRKVKLWLVYSLLSLVYVAIGLVGAALPEGARVARMGAFCAGMALFLAVVNLLSPAYIALLTDNCPMRRRGRLFGYRAVTLGLAGIAGLWPARAILAHYPGIASYHAAIVICGVLFLVSSLSPLLFRDHIDPSRLEGDAAGHRAPHARGFTAALRDAISLLPRLVRSANYRVFIFFAIIIAGAASIGPFEITYAADMLAPSSSSAHGVHDDFSLRFRLVYLAAIVVSGIFVGLVPDRFGYKVMLAAQAIVGVISFGIALGAASLHAAMIAYGLQACMTLGMQVVLNNLSIELMPRITPGRLFAAANVLCLPVNVICPWISGYVLDAARGEPWGYHVIFSVAMTLAAVGGIGAMLLVQEPRTGRVYEIKVMQRV